MLIRYYWGVGKDNERSSAERFWKGVWQKDSVKDLMINSVRVMAGKLLDWVW